MSNRILVSRMNAIPSVGDGTSSEFEPDPVDGTAQDFGDVEILTTSAAKVIAINNPGSENLIFTTCELSGTDIGDFSLSGCPASILPGGSAQLSLSCQPLSAGSKSASLDIVTNDPGAGTASYALLCNAIHPEDIFSDDFEL